MNPIHDTRHLAKKYGKTKQNITNKNIIHIIGWRLFKVRSIVSNLCLTFNRNPIAMHMTKWQSSAKESIERKKKTNRFANFGQMHVHFCILICNKDKAVTLIDHINRAYTQFNGIYWLASMLKINKPNQTEPQCDKQKKIGMDDWNFVLTTHFFRKGVENLNSPNYVCTLIMQRCFACRLIWLFKRLSLCRMHQLIKHWLISDRKHTHKTSEKYLRIKNKC